MHAGNYVQGTFWDLPLCCATQTRRFETGSELPFLEMLLVPYLSRSHTLCPEMGLF